MFTKVFLIVGHQNLQANYKAQTFNNEVLEVVATIQLAGMKPYILYDFSVTAAYKVAVSLRFPVRNAVP